MIGASLFGIKLVGLNGQNLQKLLLTLALLVLLLLLSSLTRGLLRLIWREHPNERARFWGRQGISLTVALVFILGVVSIWFNDPTRLATALGLVSAGLAFALQKVVTSVAGYFVILRGKTFNVGDRITMGGVRGDVIALSFIQTTIMEMGQPPSVQSADPAVWVRSRQYTGRIVTVSNDKIFDEPVYNYTRDFPYIWEEMPIPITYAADRGAVERILLDCAARHTVAIREMGEEALSVMQRRYGMRIEDFTPKVFYRITDNWLELTVRFMVRDHGIRDLKDAMARDILDAFDAAGIGIASATYDIIGFPAVRLQGDSGGTKQGRPDASTTGVET
ncbi:MAG: mechanosensitive ion channel domain-containing protein [Actinomycetota bacterium]